MAYKTEAQKKLDKKTEADKKALAKKAAKPTPVPKPKKSPPTAKASAPKVVTIQHPPLKPLVDAASQQPAKEISNEELALELAEQMSKRSDLPPGARIEMWNGKPTIMVPTGETVQQQNFSRELLEPAGLPPPALEATLLRATEPTPEYKQLAFRAALTSLETLRSTFHAPVVSQRLLGYAMDCLLANSPEEAEKALRSCREKADVFFHADSARGVIPGPITAEGQQTQAKKLEDLANFLAKQGSKEKADQYRAEAQEIRTADIAAVKLLPKQELDMTSLNERQKLIFNLIRDRGNAITADDLHKELAPTPDEIKGMLRTGLLVNPREGVYRIEEASIAKGVPKIKGVARAKTPKAEKPEKAPKVPKAPKVVDPNAPPRPPRKTGEIVNPTGKCLCGCGTECAQTSRFKPGHDAKLHGAIVKAARADDKDRPAMLKALPLGNETTVAYLKQAPWMTAEVAKAVGI